ncbi:hypothetical protein ACWA1F_12220 [Flavobacterium sp. 3-218]
MKKLLLLFIAFNLVTSCSSDENPSVSDNTIILPKTISYIYPNVYLGTNKISTLKYDGKKIVSSIDSDSKSIFMYSGDVITKQVFFRLDQQKNETKIREVDYTYENGKLKTRIYKTNITVDYPEGEYIEKTVYAHTSNEFISYTKYSLDKKTKAETKISEGNLTYKDGNLIKEQQKVNAVTQTQVYDYDSKNNPLKDIAGFDLLLNEVAYYGKNNILKTTKTSSENSNTSVFVTSYTYNDNGYPLKNTSLDGGGKDIEYEIEYTY